MKYLQFLLIFGAALLMGSCATVLTGTTQRVTIDSNPQGADIIVDGRMMGTTPLKVRLDRDINAFVDGGKDIRLELPGYYPDGYYLGTDIEPTCILNVFFIPGFAIDAVTGALMRYDSNYYQFRLIPNQAPGTSPSKNNVSSGESQDDYEKLMKLVELYEEGLITEDEFESQKAEIFKKRRE